MLAISDTHNFNFNTLEQFKNKARKGVKYQLFPFLYHPDGWTFMNSNNWKVEEDYDGYLQLEA